MSQSLNKENGKPPQGFVDIPGYEGRYAISRDGQIFSYPNGVHRRGKILKYALCSYGYPQVTLVDSLGKARHIRTHRLLAKTYLTNPDPENYIEVNHINGIKTDNSLDNLEWCTPSQNMKHAYALGLNYTSEEMRARLRISWVKVSKLGRLARMKPIIQLSLDGQFIQEFESAYEAERVLKIHNSAIIGVIKGRRRSAGGFKWVRAEQDSK